MMRETTERLILLLYLLCSIHSIHSIHFNGGTITWSPVDASSNASSITITITQTYSWAYPIMNCANNVPISTSGRTNSNDNLTCVAGCGTDGGYSANPINILTDCVSFSSSLGTMASSRSVNVTLLSNANFSIAYQGAAWRSLNYPPIGGLDWSILCSINLRKRPDGLINTPPVVNIVSPQYVIVNRTTKIRVPVSDVNQDDDVRCRWATYQQGYRRRRNVNDKDAQRVRRSLHSLYGKITGNEEEYIRLRVKRQATGSATSGTSATVTATNPSPTATGTDPSPTATTSETPGTKRSTSSFIHRQAIDECGGICYPSSMPNNTNLSDCTITFTGLVAGAWYAVALQVRH